MPLDVRRECLVHEIKLLGRLRHENIVRAVTRVAYAREPYYVMECYDNSLWDWYRARPADATEVSNTMLRQILSALAYMHNLGYTHGDVHPKNILSKRRAGVWRFALCDLGNSRSVNHDGSIIRASSTHVIKCCSTPASSSPECIDNRETADCKGCDVWGIAFTAVWVAGGRPWGSANIREDQKFRQLYLCGGMLAAVSCCNPATAAALYTHAFVPQKRRAGAAELLALLTAPAAPALAPVSPEALRAELAALGICAAPN